MKIFVDSCNAQEIAELKEIGLADGVTTNPSLVAQSKRDIVAIVKDICQVITTSVSVQVVANTCDEMLRAAEKFLVLGEQVTIKLPFSYESLRACHMLVQQRRMVNMTLCFTTAQALSAAKAGATLVSPFIGRLEDNGQSGMDLLAEIVQVYSNYPRLGTEVMAASVRNQRHLIQAALLGADVVTAPAKLIKEMINHPLTDIGMERFRKDHHAAVDSVE